MQLQLTDEQRQAVVKGEPIRVCLPELGKDIVILHLEQFDKLQELLSRQKLDKESVVPQQGNKEGVRAILGKWPGDETDERIEYALRELS